MIALVIACSTNYKGKFIIRLYIYITHKSLEHEKQGAHAQGYIKMSDSEQHEDSSDGEEITMSEEPKRTQ